jgi:hypothetical protein
MTTSTMWWQLPSESYWSASLSESCARRSDAGSDELQRHVRSTVAVPRTESLRAGILPTGKLSTPQSPIGIGPNGVRW